MGGARRGGLKQARKSQSVHVKAANQYARDVTSGRILACKWTIAACRRHLDDLQRAKGRDFPFRFDPAKAHRPCKFIELLPHTKGKWAVGKPGLGGSNQIRLEPWQKFIVCAVFGWVRKGSGTRRFRKAYICVPRKNGKSAKAAGIGLYMFLADGEHGAEVYSGATTEKQAWEVFRPAKQMVERTPRMRAAFGVEAHRSNLHVARNGSRFEPVIGRPGDGASPSCAIVDEYHEHKTEDLYDTMLTGMGAREQPLLLVITTAGSNIAGPCHALQQDLQKVLDGSLVDEELFGVVYGIDEGDDWTTDEALRKANPNFGVSVSAEFLRARLEEAKQSSRKQNTFKTKHLNIWVGARSAWMNMELWHAAADKTLRAEDFAGERCWGGLDLASKIDATAKVLVFKRMGPDPSGAIDPETGQVRIVEHYYMFGRYYLPAERAEEPEAKHYHGWVHDGHLVATEGRIIDYAAIREDLVDDAAQFELAELGVDPYGATQLMTELVEEGIEVLEIPMRVSHLSEPMKWLEALVLAGRFHHDGNPVMNWMMSNVTARVDANDNVFPRKEAPENKIDGPVALIMAIGRAMLGGGGDVSVYDERGVLTL